MAETHRWEPHISTGEKVKRQIRKTVLDVGRAISLTGMARKTKLPNVESLDLERTLDERFERGEMSNILRRIWRLRSATTDPQKKEFWNDKLQAAWEISKRLSRNLDILNNQYYDDKSLRMVSVKLDGENYQVPVRLYSLKDVSPPQKEPPLIILGGVASGHKVTKGPAEAIALQYPGRDVYVVSYPDNERAVVPPNFAKKVEGEKGFDVYMELLKRTVEELKLEKFDLMGFSMGGGFALSAVSKDGVFAKKIRNLMLISPTNIQKSKNWFEVASGFTVESAHGLVNQKELLRGPRPQANHELGTQPGTGWLQSTAMVGEKMFPSDILAQIKVDGRILVITGEGDRLISAQQTLKEIGKANEKRIVEGKNSIEVCVIENGRHNVGGYAPGIVRLIDETEVSGLPSEYPISKLENSTVKILVKEDSHLASVADQII